MTVEACPDIEAAVERLTMCAKAAVAHAAPCTAEYAAMRDAQSAFHALISPRVFLEITTALLSERKALREALANVLVRDTKWSPSGMPADCNCINLSREAEREYEAGRCPHQIAHQALKGGADVSR